MESESLNDNTLALQAANDDLSAFQTLVERYQRPVYRMTHQLTNHHHTAEDLAQEAFVRAFRNIDRFDPKRGPFSTWLYTITRNLCRNAWRDSRLQLHGDEAELTDDNTPAISAQRREDSAQLDEALSNLDEPFRTAFILTEIEELPLAEAAKIEGVALGTIKSRVSRAKQRLREALPFSPIDS